MRMSHPVVRPCVAALLAAGSAGCRGEKLIRGMVLDYESRKPVAGAVVTVAQNGWGMTSSGPVWDQTYLSRVATDGAGRFTLRYNVGSSANLSVEQASYSRFYHWYEPGSDITVFLRPLVEVPRSTRDGMLHLGLFANGGTYGWSFAAAETGDTCESADVIPVRMGRGDRDPITVRACGSGGVSFVSAESLGVDDLFLLYADSVPEAAYTNQATLDFTSRGGVLFVRTRDGAHYAKIEFQPASVASEERPNVVRDLMLHFVYDRAGSSVLRFAQPPINMRSGAEK